MPVEIPANLLVGGMTAVDDHAVGVETPLAAGACPRPASQAVGFMAGSEGAVVIALREIPAVQGAGVLVEAVDVFHDVDFPIHRPGLRPQHPEAWPVTQLVRRVRLPDGGRHHHLAAGGCGKPAAFGLHPGRGPRVVPATARAVAKNDEIEMAAAIEVNVVPRRGHRLDLAGAENAPAGVVLPVPGIDAAVRGTVEGIGPDLFPRGDASVG